MTAPQGARNPRQGITLSAPFAFPARRDARVSARRVETTKRAFRQTEGCSSPPSSPSSGPSTKGPAGRGGAGFPAFLAHAWLGMEQGVICASLDSHPSAFGLRPRSLRSGGCCAGFALAQRGAASLDSPPSPPGGSGGSPGGLRPLSCPHSHRLCRCGSASRPSRFAVPSAALTLPLRSTPHLADGGSRARPEAAARSEAKGPGEDVGEAFTLDATGAPQPREWGQEEGQRPPPCPPSHMAANGSPCPAGQGAGGMGYQNAQEAA